MRRTPFTLIGLSFWCLATTGSAQQGPPFLEAIRTDAEFVSISLPSVFDDEVERLTKYLTPAADEPELLGTLFQNLNLYEFHFEFLREVFPERFAGLDSTAYLQLVEKRSSRQYFAGSLSRFNTAEGVFYGFSVFTDTSDLDELPLVEEVQRVYDQLRPVFSLGELRYAPEGFEAAEAAAAWGETEFPVYLGRSERGTYQAYTRAVNYGTVRILTLAEFLDANDSGGISWRDILVLDQAPSDIEGVVAGVVTARPQGELSHVVIRTARRGTPNCFLAGAMEEFAPLSGQLIRLEVRRTEYLAEAADIEKAEAWWRDHRPSVEQLPAIDEEYAALDSLSAMDLASAPESRYGGKASNLARLGRILDGEFAPYREVGFAIPLSYYLDFMRANRMPSALDPGRQVSYEQYLEEIFTLEEFQNDSALRFEMLENFRDFARANGVVPQQLVTRVALRILEVFGNSTLMVRCRSSSNVEDALEFNGAGLYESTSMCAADELDLDAGGPSRCDPTRSDERGIARALKKVWTSLWTFRAFEEREYFQIPQDLAAMGILVTRAFRDEQANGVAFTGDPANALDRRYLVTAQLGEESVVSPAPGVRPEKHLLEVDANGTVDITRVQRSSLVPAGESVLADSTLRELGALLRRIDLDLDVDLGNHRREDVLFDVEFKVEAAGSLALKQVRPFLVSEPADQGPTFILDVPEGAAVCGNFGDGRPPRDEYDVKSQIHLVGGRHELPTDRTSFPGKLVAELLFGPEREPARIVSDGTFDVEVFADGRGVTSYRFRFEQTFRLASGELFELVLFLQGFETRRGEEIRLVQPFDEEFIVGDLVMVGVPDGDRDRVVRYQSCSGSTLPLWEIDAELAGGARIRLEERFLERLQGSGPALLTRAEVTLGGVSRAVDSYWDLVYAAQHHNVQRQHWVVFDAPIAVPNLGNVKVVELSEPDSSIGLRARARYLDEGFAAMTAPDVLVYSRCLAGTCAGGFRRGDADSSGVVVLTDAVFILRHLFASQPGPTCPDAADFDDDGVVEITDPILILAFLFRGASETRPPGPYSCGFDPTDDGLEECVDSGCS